MPRMIRILAALTLAAGFVPAAAQKQPAPFASAMPRQARRSSSATACGVTRAFRGRSRPDVHAPAEQVKTPAKLLAQVQACNTNLAKGYFPEEEEHIAAYLNLEFYKFAP